MRFKDKIYDLPDLLVKVKEWKSKGEKVVFTNGCFDILHIGHVDYIEKASELGDKLVLAINSDAGVKRLKGPERPINDEISRSAVVAALHAVDAVIFFDEDTPYMLIKQLVPDVLVKGSDYLAEVEDPNDKRYIVGSDIVKKFGGSVQTIELVEGYSTTKAVNKLKG